MTTLIRTTNRIATKGNRRHLNDLDPDLNDSRPEVTMPPQGPNLDDNTMPPTKTANTTRINDVNAAKLRATTSTSTPKATPRTTNAT